jgi:hypothetical protein
LKPAHIAIVKDDGQFPLCIRCLKHIDQQAENADQSWR